MNAEGFDPESQKSTQIQGYLRTVLWLWIILTALVVISNLFLYSTLGVDIFSSLFQIGPRSDAWITAASVTIFWLSLGCALGLLQNPAFRANNGLKTMCCLLVMLLYINILRERTGYGDVDEYIQAIFNLHKTEPLHTRYLYPPFLATIGEVFIPLEYSGLEKIFWTANIISLPFFTWLLIMLLERYGFGQRLSPLIVFMFMLVNVPVLRTMLYGQVNLHVVNLIFAALLLYPGSLIFSALALALSVHLKSSPIVLVVPFLVERNYKWLAFFAVFVVGIAGITLTFHGVSPFTDYLQNSLNIYNANEISFRENSIDSLVRSTALVFRIPFEVVDRINIVPLLKGTILAFVLAAGYLNARHNSFFPSVSSKSWVFDSTPVLLVFIYLVSPVIWEHHAVFLSLPFLLIVRKLNTIPEWVIYTFAYVLVFLTPTFDFYPWSFGRLIGPLILVFLFVKTASRRGDGDFFKWLQIKIQAYQVG